MADGIMGQDHPLGVLTPGRLYSSTLFPFLFFLSIGWYCEAGVFGLIGCISLSPSLALLPFFNSNNNKVGFMGRDHPLGVLTPGRKLCRNENIPLYYLHLMEKNRTRMR